MIRTNVRPLGAPAALPTSPARAPSAVPALELGQPEPTHPPAVFWGASALFLLSGCTSLVYQVVWFKRFSHVWGNSTLATAAVAASFLFALGLGAHLFGRVADRLSRPLLWYGACEIGIGVLVQLVPFETDVLLRAAGNLYPALESNPAAHSLVRFLLTFLIIGPPCVLMGGTLPLLAAQFTPTGSRLRDSVGWLYAINTLGAAAGCYLAGFHLLPLLGLGTANTATAIANVAIGAASCALAMRPSARRDESARAVHAVPDDALTEPPLLPDGALAFAVCATGAAALILEIVWTRQLVLILGGSTYAFTAMLFVVLVGIGLGSLLYRFRLARYTDSRYACAAVILALVATVLVGKLLIPVLSPLVGMLLPVRHAQSVNALISVASSAALELVPAVAMGALFPLLVGASRRGTRAAGSTVGTLYAWNSIGAILGALAASLWLIPWLGLARTEAVALVAYLVVALSVLRFQGRREVAVGSLLLAGSAGLVCVALLPVQALRANSGMFMYGPDAAAGQSLLFFREGASCNVMVTEQNDYVVLRVNGKVDATSTGDMATQVGLAYFPRFLRPEAEDVLVIGFGSGTTAGASALFPRTRVVCCEIEPAVYEASPYFASVNHQPEQAANLTMVLDDGRSYLQGTRQDFDVILSEPSNPWLAGVSNLFTVECYEAIRRRLKPGGMLAQWIQTYSLTPADYALALGTVASVFPECLVLRTDTGDTVVLASDADLTPRAASVARAQSLVDSLPAVRADLAKYFETTDVLELLVTRLLLDRPALCALVEAHGTGECNTDRNLRLEFDAPAGLFARSENVDRALIATVDPAWIGSLFRACGGTPERVGALERALELFGEHPRTRSAITAQGLELAPRHPGLLAQSLTAEVELGLANRGAFRARLDALLELSPWHAANVGVALANDAEHEEAIRLFEAMVAARERSAPSWAHLGLAYESAERWQDAEHALRRAVELDPLDRFARESQEGFLERRAGAGAAL